MSTSGRVPGRSSLARAALRSLLPHPHETVRRGVVGAIVLSLVSSLLPALPPPAAVPLPLPQPAAAAGEITIGTVHGLFFQNPNNSGSLDPANLVTPVFSQDFPVIDFNPPVSAQVNCSNSTGVNQFTRPFTAVVPNPDGTCSTIVAQGNRQSAGTGTLSTFQAIFTADLTVAAAGQVTFNFFSDDGWMLGAGPRRGGTEQPTYVSGSRVNPLSATPGQQLPVVGSFNTASSPVQTQVTVSFLAAGSYPIEVDYTECCAGELALVLGSTFGNPILPPPSVPGATLGLPPGAAFSPDPVNLATGNFVSHAEDLALPGRVLRFSFTRWYNSADGTTGPLGPGWTHSYNWKVTDGGATAEVRRGDGRRDTFTRNADGSYADPPSVFDTLTKNADGTFSLSLTSQVVYSFLTAGQLTRISEPAGNQILLAYTGSNLTTITDAVGRAITLTYDGSNHVTQLQDPLGRKVTYAYDSAGRLSTITDKLGNTVGQTPSQHQWKYAYDGTTPHVATITDPDNRLRVTNTYDSQGRVAQQRDGLNALSTFAYTTGQTVLTDPRSHATTYTFDSRMRVLSQSDVVSGTTFTLSYSYDGVGNRTSVTDRNGKRTDFSYDTRGNLLTKTDPQIDLATPRYLTQFAYDSKNNPTLITDPAGFTTAMTYNATTNVLLSVTRQIDATTSATTKYEYSDAGNPGMPTRVIAPRGNTTGTPNYAFSSTMAYDAQGNLVTQIDADAAKTTFSYDGVGRLTSSVDPDGNATGGVPAEHTWATTYDPNDRQLTTFDPLNDAVQYGYDGTGDRVSLTDPNGNVTTYAYDANTHLSSTAQKPDPTGQPTLVYTTQVTRDANGNATRITQANGAVTDYAFDALNRLTSVTTHPTTATTLTTTYALDGNGHPTTRTTGDGVAVTYAYDALSRLSSVAATGLATINYAYDATSRRTQMIDGTGTTAYQYDRVGRLTQVAAPNGTLIYAWDLDGNRTSLGYPGGQAVTYSYSPGGRLTQTSDWAVRNATFAYQPSGLISTVNYPNQMIASYAFDRAQRLIGLTNTWHAIVKNQETYTLDGAGNRFALDEYVRGITADGATDHFTYGYDGLNRLTSVGGPNPESFSYDAGSNLAARTGPAATYTSDTANRLTSDGTKTYTWTGADRMLARGSDSLTFDPLGRLTAMTTHDNATLYGAASWSATDRPQGADASLVLNGTTGFAEVPDSPTLNLTADWTVEAWFKDENPAGYNHPFGMIVGKEDNQTNPEAPYFIELFSNTLRAGVRAGGTYGFVDVNLVGVSANAWHHVAASLQASTKTLTIYLDGVQAGQTVLAALSAGNTLPVDIGRGGTTGKYWQGKLDDVRLWNLVRTAAQIAGAYQTELTTAPAGLVGNWKFDDGSGTVATDSATVTRTYAYNGDGLLQSETGSATTTLLWDPASSPAKLLVLNTDRIVYAGAPLYIAHANGTATTLALDGLGSVRAELADAGPLLKSFRYAAYGTLIGASSGLPSLLGYNGELTDASGLVYLRARWYDPANGRFVSKDPMPGAPTAPGSLNAYAYVGDEPISQTDSTGLCQDPGGTGTRYCIERFIPTAVACNFICGAGDRRGPSSNSGSFRVRQVVHDDGTVESFAGTSGLGYYGLLPREGVLNACAGGRSGSVIETACGAYNGYRGFPGAPSDPIYTRVRITESDGHVSVSVFGTYYPSLEIWQYGPDGAIPVFIYDGSAFELTGLSARGFLNGSGGK